LALGAEVVSAAALHAAWREATKDYERQHVTPYIYQHPEQFRLINVESPTDQSHLRWTVDTKEDLDFVRAIYARLDGSGVFGWRDVLEALAREPELLETNRNIRQKSLEEC